MPIVVDHEQRRREVAEVAADLIATHGLERVTVREIAAATGFSTTVVSHYFRDKRELLMLAYRLAAARARRRVDAARGEGLERLRESVEAILPLDDASRRDWSVWLAFWSVATADAEFAAEQRRRSRETVDLMRELVATVQEPGADAGAAAEHLLTTIYGIALQAVFDPARWPARRQREAVRVELERMAGAVPKRRARGDTSRARRAG
jgi:AcrR family transcriptional regulator